MGRRKKVVEETIEEQKSVEHYKGLLMLKINECMELADYIMQEDRSTALRLKGVNSKLRDAKKSIK